MWRARWWARIQRSAVRVSPTRAAPIDQVPRVLGRSLRATMAPTATATDGAAPGEFGAFGL